MTQPANTPKPLEYISLSGLARWSHQTVEKVRRELKKGTIQPDAKSAKEILFLKSRASELVKALHNL